MSSLAAAAPAPAGQLSVEPRTGPTKGHLRIAWQPDTTNDGAGSLVVLRAGALLQSFREETFIPPGQVAALEMVDISGDGYEDLLFMHMLNGASEQFSLAYLWVPAKNQFVKSATLSDRGELQTLTTPGCVSATNLCRGRTGILVEDFCFSTEKGRWKRVKTQRHHCPE